MKKELDYFNIEGFYGGDQEWFHDPMMKLGGCGAVTACDCCIYFDLYKGTKLYPFDTKHVTKKDYIKFGMIMKPYLRPRWSGIDKLEIYEDGFAEFLSDKGCSAIGMKQLSGEESAEDARKALIRQIECGFPVPCLLLKHKNPIFKDFEWHWFLLTGYEINDDKCKVKAVSYGEWLWFDFDELWNTSCTRKGGLILFEERSLGNLYEKR